MRILTVLLLTSFTVWGTGCATLLKGSNEHVYVSSEPSGAKVRVNGLDVGETPANIRLSTSSNHVVEIKKDGYENRSLILTNSIGAGWIILDALCGFVPLIVDAATGSWRSFDQDAYHVNLDKK